MTTPIINVQFSPSSKYTLINAIKSYFNGTNKRNISNWDTSQITYMSYLFRYIDKISNEPITLNWDTSNVIDMSWMFYGCEQDFILNFNTGNVTDMSCMFFGATNFNQPLHFDTSNVTDMHYMFGYAINFNQPLNFDTGNVTDMSGMFYGATNFNQPLNFNTRNVTNIANMFHMASNFNQPIYFKSNCKNICIYKHSPMKGQESKYVLRLPYYYKLLLFSMLNKINPDLLYLLDTFEEFF